MKEQQAVTTCDALDGRYSPEHWMPCPQELNELANIQSTYDQCCHACDQTVQLGASESNPAWG